MKAIQLYFATAPDSHRLILLIGSLFLFWSIELIYSITTNYDKKQHAVVNTLFIFTNIPVQIGMGLLLNKMMQWEAMDHFGILNWIPDASNLWVQLIAAFIILDFFEYVYHVIMHHVKSFWQFHLVHHSDRVVDVSTSLREHPGEAFIRLSFLFLWIFLLGVPLWALLFRQFVQIVSNVFAHANFRLPEKLDQVVGWIFITPNLHHVHHHYQKPYTDCNYGDVLSIWDRMFGTFKTLEAQHTIFGIDSHMDVSENGVFGNLVRMPFGIEDTQGQQSAEV